MNSEREIINKLFESKSIDDLDKKTYTVGDKQYWKRGGKYYSWTSEDGKSECSEDEYMKAISGGTDQTVKNTDPSNDKARSVEEPSQKDYSKSKLGDEVKWNGKSYTIIEDEDDGMITLRPTDMVDDDAFEGYGDASEDVFIDRSQLKPKTSDKPKKPEPDHSESDYINYKNVKNFDHTSWDVGGYETTIQNNPYGRGYYLRNEDFDMEFDTKADLVKYLRNNNAEFYGYDSENDY